MIEIMRTTISFLTILLLNLSLVFAQEVPNQGDASQKVADAMAKKDLKGDFEEGWNKKSSFGVTFSTTGFNDNWKTMNTGVVGNTNLHFIVNHQNALVSGKNIWINDFEGQIGFLSNGSALSSNTKKEFNRNIDKLFLNSMYGRLISDQLSAFAEGNFISQFLEVRDHEKSVRNVASGFLAPGYLTVSTGIEYRPVDYFTLKIAPVANKWTIVANNNIIYDTDTGTAYGVDVQGGKKSLSEFGSQLTLGFNKEIVSNVNLGFRYNTFKAWRDSNGNKNKPLDHRLDLLATAKINKYLNVNFSYIGLLDRDMAVKGWQDARGFGVGFLANF